MGKIKPSLGRTSITGGERNGEGCYEGHNSLQEPICQPSALIIKEEWRAKTSDHSEGLEHIHILQTFQDGRAPSVKGNFRTR